MITRMNDIHFSASKWNINHSYLARLLANEDADNAVVYQTVNVSNSMFISTWRWGHGCTLGEVCRGTFAFPLRFLCLKRLWEWFTKFRSLVTAGAAELRPRQFLRVAWRSWNIKLIYRAGTQNNLVRDMHTGTTGFHIIWVPGLYTQHNLPVRQPYFA